MSAVPEVDERVQRRRMSCITNLLEHYQEVVPGLVHGSEWERSGTNGHALFAEEVWNHPAYRQLERLRIALREHQRQPYWHLAETYIRSTTRRVAVCPKCDHTAPASKIGAYCLHGEKLARARIKNSTEMIPGVVRVIHQDVRSELVGVAITWLEYRWQGDVFTLDEILTDLERRKR